MANEVTPNAAQAAQKKLTFAELTAMKLADLVTHLKKIVVVVKAVDKAKAAFTGSLQFNAKVVAALKRTYVERLNARDLPPDTTFKKFFEQNAGGPLPGRVEALASLFNALVETLGADGKPMISEECFDNAAVDWLEKGNSIISKARKQHGDAWRDCDDVKDLVGALSKPGDALKTINAIRKRQKGEQENDSEAGDVVALTVGRAVEFLKAAILGAGKMPEQEAYDLFVATFSITDNWENSGLSDDQMNAFTAKLTAAEKAGVAPHLEIVKPATPETAPAAQPTAPADAPEPVEETEPAEAVAA